MNFLQQIIDLDHQLFYFINHKWSNDFFDAVLPYFRESLIWGPLYIFLIVMVWFNFGWNGFWWVIAALCTVALSDILSSHIIKPFFERERPCNHSGVHATLILRLLHCPQNPSFTSSHAANHFALAGFIFYSLKPYINKWIAALFLVWAGIISYAQVYVGVHFPTDILGGALLGIAVGSGMSYIFNNKIGLKKPLTI